MANEPDRPPLSARRFPAADGIRGVAILMVVLHNAEFVERSSPGFLLKLTGAITATGWVGVQLFFVLSGYLITGILVDALGSAEYFRRFYIRRFLRIFPLYYTVLFLAIIVFPHFANVPEWTAVARRNQWWYWGYLSNWGDIVGHSVPAFTHFWSLAVEEQFYLAWPLLMFVLSRRGATALCVIMLMVTPLIRLSLHLLGLPQQAAYEFTVARWDALAAGALVALLMRDAPLQHTLARWIGRITGASLGALAAIVAYERGFHANDLIVQVAGQSLIALLSASLVYYCVADTTGTAVRVQRVMSVEWLRFFGKYSYAIYVFHFPIQHVLGSHLGDKLNAGDQSTRFIVLVMYLACIVGMSTVTAIVSWNLLEKPFLDLKDRLAPRAMANVSHVTPGM